MTGKSVVELIRPWAVQYAASVGCVIWDIRFLREAGEWCLKVTLDTVPPGNVNIDMCESVNRLLDAKLDELDPIEQQYTLEVSSPGINRELYRPSDFDMFTGAKVDIRLFKKNSAGVKEFTAQLQNRQNSELNLLYNQEEIRIPISDIAQCRIHFDFD